MTLLHHPDECNECAHEVPLRAVVDRLQRKGLDARLTNCGVVDGHFDSIQVTNPRKPERGTLHIDDDGTVAWHYFAGKLDDEGIGRLVGEAIDTLRGTGRVLPRRERGATIGRTARYP